MKLLLLGVFFLLSFVTTYIIIPKIIKIVLYKNLLDKPNDRSSHSSVTPTLGGVAFFIVLILSMVFLKKWDNDYVSLNFVVGLTVLFIVGLKDDLVALSAKVKAIAQIIAISFLIFDNDFLCLHSLQGFLGFSDMNHWGYIPIIYFSMFFIINSFNLIDGIDGLASTIGMLIFSIYATMFFMLGEFYYAAISIVLIGTLLAFLNYNFSDKRKIFMGDTGSMIIGFMIAILTFKMLTLNVIVNKINVLPENLPILLLSIITIPLLDTIRVFIVRTLNGKSFFIADRNHIHHIFLDLGLTHKKATFFIASINFTFVLLVYLLSSTLTSFKLLLVYVFLSIVFYLWLYLFRSSKMERNKGKMKIFKKVASALTFFY